MKYTKVKLPSESSSVDKKKTGNKLKNDCIPELIDNYIHALPFPSAIDCQLV